MTIQEKKELVRQEIIKANRSKFEVLIRRRGNGIDAYDALREDAPDIGLSDVLVAIQKSCTYSNESLGSIFRDLLNNGWDLSQDFDHQSKAMISFLYGLLV